MTEDNASGLTNLWKLNMEDRWRMYRYWLKKFINIQHEQLHNNEKRYIEIFEEYTRASRELDEAIMSNATVIAMTTTSAARYNESLNKVGPTVAIVEEAAEVPEPHIVAAINHKCQHVILIGDHKQLEPKPFVVF
jgi:superfamily I DNA and/or RNA helicase